MASGAPASTVPLGGTGGSSDTVASTMTGSSAEAVDNKQQASTSTTTTEATGITGPTESSAGIPSTTTSDLKPSNSTGVPSEGAEKSATSSSAPSGIGIQNAAAEAEGEKTISNSSSNSTAGLQVGSSSTAGPSTSATMAAPSGPNGAESSTAAALAKSPINPSAGTTAATAPTSSTTSAGQPATASSSSNSAPASNQPPASHASASVSTAGNARSPAVGAAAAATTTTGGTGTASPGYKPFDYSQPLSTYSPAVPYGSGMRRSPATTPGAPSNPSPNSNPNPIAAGFTYGATGQRAGSGLNPQSSNTNASQQQQQAGSVSPGTAASAANRQSQAPLAQGAGVQSRTGNNATPLTAPSLVSRTSGTGPSPGATAGQPEPAGTAAASSTAAASQNRTQTSSSTGTAAPNAPPSSQSRNGQPAQLSNFQSRYGQGHYGSQNSLPTANAQGTRDPRTPNPVTESLLSRSPVSAAAASPAANANTNASVAGRPAEQSRTGGIATPLAPGAAGAPSAGSTAATASPSASVSGRESPGPKPATGQPGAPPASAGLSWRSLIDRPFPSPYGPGGSNPGSRTQSPSQRSGLWFNPLAVKQQSTAQAQQQAQQQAQAQAQAQAAGQRASSAAASPAGSPQQSSLAPNPPPASGAPGNVAQTQANKRRTHSTSAATPPYDMSSMYGNRPGSLTAEARDGSQPARAVTASPVVGAAAIPTPSSAPATASPASASAASRATASPGHQHRSSYSMTYGDRLQQLQAQTVRDRERERDAREREMRERERTAAAIAAGPKTSQGSPALSIARSPYYGMTGSSSSGPSAAGKAASPPAVGAPPTQSPLSPPRKAAERPSSTSAFGYLFGGGGASRVATEGGASQAAKAAAPGSHASGVTAGGASGQAPTQSGHYRTASGTAQTAAQQQQQQAQQAATYRQGLSGASTPVSRTQNTGLGLTAQANWRGQGYNGPSNANGISGQAQTALGAERKSDSSPQLPAQQAAGQKSLDSAVTVNGHKRKYSDAQDNVASRQITAPSQPPPATLHALRQREGPLFTAEDIKGAALRPPLMIVRSDNVVKALHKLSAQHHANASATSPPSAPFLGRVVYNPFVDPAKLLDADLLRKGVGGKVEIWLDTEWLKGEVWEAGAPSHPAVSHPPSPAGEDMDSHEDLKTNGTLPLDGMQIDAAEGADASPEFPLQADATQRREDLPASWTLWDVVPLKERKIWGTDVYTDDSDILAACIHSGWLRLGSTAPLFGAASAGDDAKQKRKRRKRKPTLDHRSLKITIVVAPKLIKYEGSLRAGVWSRTWGNSHDGVSYAIESVELVEKARHRLTPTRWKSYDTSFTNLAKQRCSCTMACEHVEKTTLYPKSLKLGEALLRAQ